MKRFILLLILTAPFLFEGCVVQKNPVTGRKRAYAYTWQQEINLGRDADKEIVAQYGLLDNPKLANYIVEIGEKTLKESHLRRPKTDPEFQNTAFTFRMLDNGLVNAFALPGGYVYFTRGIMAYLNNEAQLVMVMGHEIGHVAARHASRRTFEQQMGQIALIGGAAVTESVLGIEGTKIVNVGGAAAQLLLLSYGRGDELESDRLGVEYAALLGYKASEGAAFFQSLQRMQKAAGGGVPTHLSTHPDPGDREKRIKNLSTDWAKKGYAQDELGEERYLSMIEGIVMGENLRNGYHENGVYYHPELAFQFPFPQDWHLINEPSRVIVVNKQQDAVTFIQMATGSNLTQIVDEVARQDGFTILEEGVDHSNGKQGVYKVAGATLKDGSSLTFFIAAVQQGQHRYRLLSYAPSGSFDSYKSIFAAYLRGFQELKDVQRLNVQPARLSIVTADREAPFSSFLPQKAPYGLSLDDLAIMNQVRMDERIPKGRKLKLPKWD